MSSLLSIRGLEASEISEILATSMVLKSAVESRCLLPALPPRTVGLLLFEDSTRTRVSFEQAASYLGYKSVNFSSSGSSMQKGETLKDTILTLKNERLDAVVMRHSSSGACNLAQKYFGGAVINAGDGRHEHPTQALGDALTLMCRGRQIKGLKVAIVGDIAHSRVARSNCWLLHKLGAEVRFVGPRNLLPGQTSKLPAKVYHDMRSGLEGVDVVMALRLQRERMADGLVSIKEYRRLYQINRSALRYASPIALVMHPGPMNRGVEIDDTTADGPASTINEQVMNCIYVRMAVLARAFGDKFDGLGGTE